MSDRHSQRGQALEEFALATAAFLLIFLGIIDFGETFYNYDQLAQAAKLGARWAIVNTNPPTSDCATAGGTCQTSIVNYILSATTLTPASLTTTITFGGTPTNSAQACNTQPTPGCWINVQLQYPFSFGGLRLPAGTLSGTSQMVIASQHP